MSAHNSSSSYHSLIYQAQEDAEGQIFRILRGLTGPAVVAIITSAGNVTTIPYPGDPSAGRQAVDYLASQLQLHKPSPGEAVPSPHEPRAGSCAAEILDILRHHAGQHLTAKQLIKEMDRREQAGMGGAWSLTKVTNNLATLHDQGFITRTQGGKPYGYRAEVTRPVVPAIPPEELN